MGLMSCLPNWLAPVRGLCFVEEQFRDNSCRFPSLERLRHRQLPQSCDNIDNQAPTDLHEHDGCRVQAVRVRSRHPCIRVKNSTTLEIPPRHRFQAVHLGTGVEECWTSSEKFEALKGRTVSTAANLQHNSKLLGRILGLCSVIQQIFTINRPNINPTGEGCQFSTGWSYGQTGA